MGVQHPNAPVMDGPVAAVTVMSLLEIAHPWPHSHSYKTNTATLPVPWLQGHSPLSSHFPELTFTLLAYEAQRSTQWDLCSAAHDVGSLIILILCHAVIGKLSK